ncbi:hypothetical protein NP603_20150 [Methylomonas sp. SURF-1]|uniref:Uncharacterized protein n=1 Tax=Methylomonas aurea TaxID=2952224 RepID=A0ABT1UMH5_9GAMM|nr:hypothetical protein [Methylomonas sp. SURF-1]MCQ8183435.1 hypothetical protein [Methylomonas sp. SURF-1]
MKKLTTASVIFLGLLGGIGFAQQAAAHDQAGGLSSLSGPGATDFYEITCANDAATGTPTNRLFFKIRDVTPGGNLVGMTVVKGVGVPTNGAATTTVDNSGNDSGYSADAEIKGGNGVYNVLVWHTGVASNESYTFQYHCDNGSVHTATSIKRVSNQ